MKIYQTSSEYVFRRYKILYKLIIPNTFGINSLQYTTSIQNHIQLHNYDIQLYNLP